MTAAVDFAGDVAAELDREGFVVVRGVLAGATVAALQTATDELEALAKDFVTDTVVRNSGRRGVFFEMQSQSGRKREPAVVPGALRKITGPSKGHAAFRSLRTDAGILEIVRRSGLAHPRCVVDQVNIKHPQVGTGFPFHQDAAFLHGDARESLQRFGGLNVVVALDAADAENGGFTVLGGSHKQGLLRDQHGYDTSTMNEGVFDESRRQTPSLAPGDGVFFLPLLAHGSGPNLSMRRRRLATLWFVGGALS